MEAQTTTGTTTAAPIAPPAPTTSSTMASSTQASAPTTETVNPGAWMAGFNDDLKGYVATKGFKDPATIADAYRNLEKLQGVPQDRLMKLPEKFYGDDGKLTTEGRQIYERLGAPKDAKEYGLDKFVPKEGGDPKLMEHFSSIFAEAGIPKSAAEKIASGWNEYQALQVGAMKEAAQQKFNDETNTLKKDWGSAFDQNTQIAKEGLRRLGHDSKTADALSTVLGHAATMKLYHQLGSAVGESAFVTGRAPASGILEPTTAKSKIQQYRQDKGFMVKVASGDVEANALWTRLHEQAFPGDKAI